MAGYKRRRRFRRGGRRGKRRRYMRRRGGLQRAIQRVLQRTAEKKRSTWPLPTYFTSVTTAWTEFWIAPAGIGINENQFTGHEYRLKKIWFSGWLQGGQVGGDLDDISNLFRIVVAKWNNSAGTTPLQTLAATINSTVQKNIWPNALQKVYMNKTISLLPRGLADYDESGLIPARRYVRFIKRFKGAGLKMTLDTGGFPESRIIVSMISDSTAVPNCGFVNGHIGCTWTDL